MGTWALGHLGVRQALDAGMGAAANGKRVNDTLCVSDIIITIITIITIIAIIIVNTIICVTSVLHFPFST